MELLDWINSFGFDYKRLTEVKRLNLRANKIKKLHPDFNQLKLYYLDISCNPLKEFHYESKCLRTLDISECPLESLSLEAPNLNKMDVGFTELSELVLDLPKLTKLQAGCNFKLKVLKLNCPRLNSLNLNSYKEAEVFSVCELRTPYISDLSANCTITLRSGQEFERHVLENRSMISLIITEDSLLSNL